MKIRGHLNEQNLCREDVAPTSDSRPVQFLRPPGCVAVNYVSSFAGFGLILTVN